MTVQKFINYKILNKDGTILSYESENKFELKMLIFFFQVIYKKNKKNNQSYFNYQNSIFLSLFF